jgi:hypothetical protein
MMVRPGEMMKGVGVNAAGYGGKHRPFLQAIPGEDRPCAAPGRLGGGCGGVLPDAHHLSQNIVRKFHRIVSLVSGDSASQAHAPCQYSLSDQERRR